MDETAYRSLYLQGMPLWALTNLRRYVADEIGESNSRQGDPGQSTDSSAERDVTKRCAAARSTVLEKQILANPAQTLSFTEFLVMVCSKC